MPSKTSTVHSIRTPNGLWRDAKRRADKDGVRMNAVVNDILRAYADGYIDLPERPRPRIRENA